MPRFEVLVEVDGEQSIVQAGRPAALVAFADEFGHGAPENMPELAWLTHKALRIEASLAEWLETLDDLDGNPIAVEKARALKAGEAPLTGTEALERAAATHGLSPGALEQAIVASDGGTPTPGPAAALPVAEPTAASGGE